MSVSRRRFVATGLACGALSVAACRGPGDWFGGDGGSTTSPSATEQALVVVTLTGGNDGLNTIVPVGDSDYAGLRRDLAVPADTTFAIGEGFALAPQLEPLRPMWEDGRMAIVHGVGTPDVNLSHFASMATWHTGLSDAGDPTGWLGRWLDTLQDHDPLRAISVGSALPQMLVGSARAGSAVEVGGLGMPAEDGLADAWTDLASSAVDGDSLDAAMARSVLDLGVLREKLGEGEEGTPGGSGQGGESGRGALTVATEEAARILSGGFGTRVVAVTLGGFDTHTGQETTHDRLLGDLASGLVAFFEALDADAPQVTVVVWSEFGRRVQPNGSGTDHGAAGPVLVLGPRVKAGHHGEPPPLSDLDEAGNLRVTTDFRRVLGAVCEAHLGVAASDIFPDAGSAARPLGLF
ncbi:MAG: DUF1501 domain-containing protein [Acidimicrobiia bacterium]|nr:DUF1501 domain-containing protein [Acidimicrobiia bacterium]